MYRKLIPAEYTFVEETDEHILYVRYIPKIHADRTANIIRRPAGANNASRMREEINTAVGKEVEQLRIIIMLMKADRIGNPMVESLFLDDISHLPRVGDTICYFNTYYEVCDVTWDYGIGEVVVDAWVS
jgi:hypothetical protein